MTLLLALLAPSLAATVDMPMDFPLPRDVRVTKRVEPTYPDDVPDSAEDFVVCEALVRVDRAGNGKIEPQGCPEPFATQTLDALSKWEWVPWDGEAEEAGVLLEVRYLRRGRGHSAWKSVTVAAQRAFRPVRRTLPKVPRAARKAPPDSGRCPLTVAVEPDGSTGSVDSSACPEAFRKSAERAVSRWEWAVPVIEGVPRGGTFALEIDFRVAGGGVEPEAVASLVPPDPPLLEDDTFALRDGDPEAAQPISRGAAPVMSRVAPAYPHQAMAKRKEDVTCKVTVAVEPSGAPYHLALGECPVPFRRAAADALADWRWEPVLVDGEPIAFRVVTPLVFRYAGE